jgi:hypothetical protein
MTRKWAKVIAAAIAFGFVFETSFTPGVARGIVSEASAFGRGGGGFHGGGFHGFGGLDALANALAMVRPALSDVYNSLTDEQKARFNVIGSGAPKSAR